MAKYLFNGIEYPSVTTITGLISNADALIGWAKRETINALKPVVGNILLESDLSNAIKRSDELSNEAKDIGSEVHNLIEQYIKNSSMLNNVINAVKDDRVYNGFQAFLDWEKLIGVKWIESERSVVNEEIGYAGTLDAIAEIEGKIITIDFKSSSGIYPEYWAQVAAYLFARKSMSGEYELEAWDGNQYKVNYNSIIPSSIAILRLDKKTGIPEYQVKHECGEINRAFDYFRNLVSVYYLQKDRRLKNNKISLQIKEKYRGK